MEKGWGGEREGRSKEKWEGDGKRKTGERRKRKNEERVEGRKKGERT